MNQPITIVGGGLAGLSLAHGLLKQGATVTVYEAGHYPRHKVCGEFICGASQSTLETLGIQNVIKDCTIVREIEFKTGPGNSLRHFKLPQEARGLSRWALEARLAELVRTRGGVILEHQRLNPVDKLTEGTILCYGRTKTVSSALGLKVHMPNTRELTRLELYLGRNAYVGISPIEENQLNVCGLFMDPPRGNKHHRINFMIEACKQAGLMSVAQQLATGAPIESSFIGTTQVCFHEKAAPESGLHLGDAAMAIAPFTGNGMSLALESAASALEPIIRYVEGGSSWDQTIIDIQS
ncbi:MAG: hypothetical protein B7X06_04495, partial [Verrucomicrobia bacterium 21-51-4]